MQIVDISTDTVMGSRIGVLNWIFAMIRMMLSIEKYITIAHVSISLDISWNLLKGE